jgi:hypothetical protein
MAYMNSRPQQQMEVTGQLYAQPQEMSPWCPPQDRKWIGPRASLHTMVTKKKFPEDDSFVGQSAV